MVFQKRNHIKRDSRRFSISEWDGAPLEEASCSDHSGDGRPHADVGGDVQNTNEGAEGAPEMNLGSVYDAVRRQEGMARRGDGGDDETGGGGGRRRSSGSIAKQLVSFRHHQFRRASSARGSEDLATTASHVSHSSSDDSNIWTKLMAREGTRGLWENQGKDVYDDADEFDEDAERHESRSCGEVLKGFGLALWYEMRHFVQTMVDSPQILLLSLATFGILCGLGVVAVNGERDNYVKKQMMNADFIARETGEWFANEFRKAMVPLYAVQQAVVHSSYFDDAASEIGRYPNFLIEETVDDPKVMRNVTRICDDPELRRKWKEIVRPVNEENDLDGVVFAYRLAPSNVFCLYERDDDDPANPDKSFGFDAGSSPANEFWRQIMIDMFVHREYSIFGPFNPKGDLEKEWVCGHIPVWAKPNVFDSDAHTLDVQGVEVENAWGFVMNYLDWGLLKTRSSIHERFAGCNLDFELTHAPKQLHPKVTLGNVLAHSPNSDLLDENNSVIISTNSLHGVWENRVGSINGWSPPWYPATIVVVVVSSLILAFLVASTLVERKLHRNLVHKMLPPRAIAKLHRGQTVLEKFNPITIFFSDIVGFTSMAGNMRPIQVMKMLNELYTELDKLTEKHRVYKVETIGDAYMVVGGAPERVPAPVAAERVALFALDAIDLVERFRTEDGGRIFIRAGLASGPTVAGVVGQSMPRYCFFGDTVNFASRMESTSKKMRIQCAEITFRLLRDAPNRYFELTKRMEGDISGVNIKGKGHQTTYWIETSTPRNKNQKVAPGFTSEMLAAVSEVEDAPEVMAEEGKGNITSDANSEKDHEELPKFVNSAAKQLNESDDDAPYQFENIDSYTSDKIHAALAAQDWDKLGHASSALCVASEKREVIITRASALLEHHLFRVLKDRNSNASMPSAVKTQCREFVTDVASMYNEVKFHSLSHAMHVTTSMNRLLADALNEVPLNSFSLVFSALLHDAGHTGMSNKILAEIKHPLSEQYEQGVPIAEKYSIDIALQLLFRPQYDAFRLAILPNAMSKIEFAKTLFQGILVTDIASSESNKLHTERYQISQGKQPAHYDTRICPLANHIDSVFDGVELEVSVKEEYPNEFVITHQGLRKCVKNEHLMLLSDVSHLIQGWENFAKWNFRLYKEICECWKNGLCDDPREGWFQGQIGFINNYILPLATRCQVYFNKEFADALVTNGRVNLKLWEDHGVKATAIMIKAAEDGEDELNVLLRLYELPSL